MADNVAITAGSGTPIATDEISGAHHQKVKIEYGDADSATMVSASNPLPTTIQDGGNSITVDDGSGSLTVDGTVAATQSGTWTEANSASIKTSVELIDDAVYTDGSGTPSKGIAAMGTDGTNPQIISTNATGHLNIADGGNSITVDNGGTFAVQAAQSGTWTEANSSSILTSAQLLDDVVATIGSAIPTKGYAVSGTDGTNARVLKTDSSGELQVDVLTLPALAAGTNAIGKLAANSGVDIGDVDVTSISAGDNTIGRVKLTDGTTLATVRELGTNDALNVSVCDGSGNQITSFGGGTQYAEDAALGSTPTGTVAMGKRDASLSTTSPVDDDAMPLRLSSRGALWVVNDNSVPVALSLTVASDSGATTADNGLQVLGIRQDADTSPVSANLDYHPFIFDNAGNLKVNVKSGSSSGTQYTEADTDATITGTAVMWEDTSDTLRAVSAAKPLPVNVISGSAAGTEYTEDAAAAANPAGPMTMAVRADALAGVTSADGDNIAIRATDKGELYVKQSDSVAATQSGTWNVNNISGTVSLPTGAATAAKQPALGTAGTASSDVITVQGIASMTALKVDGSAVTQPVSGTVTVSQGTAANLNCTEASASAIKTSVELIDDAIVADDAAFTPATTKVMMAGFEFDDTTPDSVNEGDAGAARMSANRNIYMNIRDAAGNERGANVNASNQLSVSVDAALPAGTNAIGKLAANSGVDIGDVDVTSGPTGASAFQVQGTVAHDSADAQNPVGIGANARTTNQTAVTDGDRVRVVADDVGRLIFVLNQCRDLTAVQQTTITSSTAETTIVTAAGAGVFADLTQLTITNSSATALIVTLKDSTAGTTRGIYALAANGGIVIPFDTPLAQASANNNWTLTCGSSVASIYAVAQYVKNV